MEYIIISFGGQRYMIFPIFAPQLVGECVISIRSPSVCNISL